MTISDQKPKIKINKTSPRGRHTKSPAIVKSKTSNIDLNSKVKSTEPIQH